MFKKIVSLFLVAVMLFCFSACGNKNNSIETNSISTEPPTVDPEKIPLKEQIYKALPFSEGLAFVSLSEQEPINTCIDKKGNIKFKLTSTTDKCVSGFKDGHALVLTNNEYCLIDKKGKVVVSPETHGYTNGFGVLNNETYSDGYFPVYKVTKSFEGDTYEYGVIGSDGKWILELSSKYQLNSYIPQYNHTINYSDDYLDVETTNSDQPLWWNLKDGTVTTTVIEYDLINQYGPGAVSYCDVKGNAQIDLNEKYPTAWSGDNFKTGEDYTTVCFHNEGTMYFSLLNRNGELQFEPKEIIREFSSSTKILYEQQLCWAGTINNKFSFYDFNGNLKFELEPTCPEKFNSTYSYIIDVYYGDNSFVICEYCDKEIAYFIDENGNRFLG